jgi:hypothetical protein
MVTQGACGVWCRCKGWRGIEGTCRGAMASRTCGTGEGYGELGEGCDDNIAAAGGGTRATQAPGDGVLCVLLASPLRRWCCARETGVCGCG